MLSDFCQAVLCCINKAVPYIIQIFPDITHLHICDSINYFNLADIAESARTVCEIANYSFAGTFASDKDGNFVKYNCEVNATLGNANSANYILNSDVPLILINENNAVESLDFSELNFNGNSVSESNSIHNNSLFLNGKVLALNGSVASTDKYILKLRISHNLLYIKTF